MDADGRIPGQGLWLRVRGTLREGEIKKKKRKKPSFPHASDSQLKKKKKGHYDIVARKFKLGILAV